jgi:hypothetical protein
MSLRALQDEDITKAEVAWNQARRQALHDLTEGVAFAVAGAGSGRASSSQGSPPCGAVLSAFPFQATSRSNRVREFATANSQKGLTSYRHGSRREHRHGVKRIPREDSLGLKGVGDHCEFASASLRSPTLAPATLDLLVMTLHVVHEHFPLDFPGFTINDTDIKLAKDMLGVKLQGADDRRVRSAIRALTRLQDDVVYINSKSQEPEDDDDEVNIKDFLENDTLERQDKGVEAKNDYTGSTETSK